MNRFLVVPAMLLLFLETALAQGSANSNPAVSETAATGQMADSSYVSSIGLGNIPNSLLGGVPQEEPIGPLVTLSLSAALQRGLRFNLGAILSEQSVQATRSTRILALSQLLPRVTAGITEKEQQVNLAAFGFQGFPGVDAIVGPYSVFDARAFVSQTVMDFSLLNHYRATNESLKASQFSAENTRDLVTFICAGLYLQAVASGNRIEATQAQVHTAQVLYDLALSQKTAGVVSGIEVLRAQVELQAQQQRLIVAKDQFAKDKLTLAQAIGLPLGQEISLSDSLSFVPAAAMPLEASLQRAYQERPDYQSAQARVRAAELERKAAGAGRLPTLDVTADYGTIGPQPWKSHGTFSIATNLRIPIFQGGKVRSRVMEADAALRQRTAELADLKGRIYYEIRKGYLDLEASADRVQVSQSAVQLAEEQVRQSQDRFGAGVANNVEVVQAQEAHATASENQISSLHAHAMARLALARAMGVSDIEYEQFLRGKE